MNSISKFFSTAPVILTVWLSFTSAFIIFINFVSPDNLTFPSFY